MDLESEIKFMQAFQGLLELAPLTLETEWRKLWIEDYLEEDLDYTPSLLGRGHLLVWFG
jgi:hypothetical protein